MRKVFPFVGSYRILNRLSSGHDEQINPNTSKQTVPILTNRFVVVVLMLLVVVVVLVVSRREPIVNNGQKSINQS